MYSEQGYFRLTLFMSELDLKQEKSLFFYSLRLDSNPS